MKKLFLAILIPILFVLGTPALLATIMYDGSGEDLMPIDLYVEDADAEAMIYEELLNSLDDVTNEVEQDFIFNLHEDMINTAIFQAVLEENPDYMPTDDCATPEACYIIYEQVPVEDFDIMLRVVGAWVDFNDDLFSLNVFLEVELNDGFTYKTVITVEFKFLDEPEYYLLQFNKINVGNLPIPGSMISSVLGAIENNVDELDLEELTADLETGEADLSEFTYKLYKNEIIDLIGDDCDPETDVNCAEPTTEDKMLKQVLSEVFEQRIVVFEFSGDEFVASAQLSLFVSEDETDIPEYLYDLHDVDPITGEVGEYNPDLLDQATYLQDMFTEFTFNYALTQSNFQLTEETVNKLIYSSQDGFTDMGQVQEIELPDGTIRELELGVNGLWFEFTPEGLQAKALVKLDSISSVLTLKASKVESESTDTELVFDFTEITFGEDAEEAETDYVSITDLTVFKEMLAELGDVEFGVFDENGILTISADRLSTMMQEGSADGVIIVTGIDIVENAIEISIEAADTELQAALDGLSEELSNVIEGPELLDDLALVLDTTGGGAEQEVYEAVQDLQETLQNEEVPDPEVIEDLFDNFQEMDEETQSEFLDTFANLFDEDVLSDFETAFGSFSGGDLPIPE
jgi:hypothetical protein